MSTSSPSAAVRAEARRELFAPPTVHVAGVRFHALTFDEAVATIRNLIGGPGSPYVVLANVHTVNLAWEDAEYRAILERAALVLRDGVGVEIGARLRGRPLAYNFVGTDFVPALLASLGRERPLRVFLYGGAPGVAGVAARVLTTRTPELRIVGVEHGYGNPDAAAARIAAARADVVVVALGNPLQERWIATHPEALRGAVAIGVGALLDYLSGRVPRAPRWVRTMRAEWLYRLAVEPRRLWRRYLVGNARFLLRLMRSHYRERA